MRSACRPALACHAARAAPSRCRVLPPDDPDPTVFDEPGGDPELLRLSLLHEIAHADRWDPWFGTIASLAQTVWFFLPQIWWLRSQLLIDQEFLADRSAALRYGTSSGYAASLLSLAEARPSPAADPRPSEPEYESGPPEANGEVRSPLSQRMLMLLVLPVSG